MLVHLTSCYHSPDMSDHIRTLLAISLKPLRWLALDTSDTIDSPFYKREKVRELRNGLINTTTQG